MNDFFQFIWDSIGISTFANSELQWKNGKLIKSGMSFKEKEKVLSKLYSTVPRSTLIQVYEKYKFDYELFGFNFNYVLKIAGYQNLSKSECYAHGIFSVTFPGRIWGKLQS